MPEPLLYLEAMGAAAVASAMIVLAIAGTRRPDGSRWRSSTWRSSACVLAMGLGLALGYRVMSLRWVWPPASALDRLLTIVLPAVLGIEWIAGLPRVSAWGAWLLRLLLAAAVPRILLHGSVYLRDSGGEWTRFESGATMAASAALLVGAWGWLSWLARRSPGVSIPLSLVLSVECAGATVMMAGYLQGGAAAFPFGAMLAATSLAAALMAKRFETPGNLGLPAIVGCGVVGLFGLLFVGRFFGRISTGDALAMLFAPLLCWATELPLLRGRKPWIVGSLRLVLVAIPLVIVLAAAKREFDREMAPLLGSVQASIVRLCRDG